jgi:hypothetical protein
VNKPQMSAIYQLAIDYIVGRQQLAITQPFLGH